MLPNWINLELTSRCNKSCYFCGRAKARKEGLTTGDMPFEMFERIMSQYKGLAIQFNKDGEPLLYAPLAEVGRKCKNHITNIVTNGILLWDRHEDLQDFTTVTVSVFEDDVKQFENIKRFHEKYEGKLLVKYLGKYSNPEIESMGITTLRRTIHDPYGDVGYIGNKPTIPEFGICLDFLFKPSISWRGDFSICNRYDPDSEGVVGSVMNDPITWIWNNNPLRLHWLDLHKQGKRKEIPLCSKCEFWGIATNG